MIRITECPRDAMQGLKKIISTPDKINYLNQLLRVGFDTLDFGSFVSAKAIPQMADTKEVLEGLTIGDSTTKLLAIVANERGAKEAAAFQEISFLGFPFSISETFQQRNTNSSITESLDRVKRINEICEKSYKKLVVYLSMAFGNPYGDPWHPDIAVSWCRRLKEQAGIELIALSDTTGQSTPDSIKGIFETALSAFPQIEFGAHLHTTPQTWHEKLAAAYEAGCRKFDGAIKGFGGCPMAADDLTGNMPTENMLSYFAEKHIATGVDQDAFAKAVVMAEGIFS